MDKTKTGAYKSWNAMKYRCDNPRCGSYSKYGGQGITYCNRWQIFENFLEDMGDRPEGMTIDRIDPAGNYGPENCRWLRWKDQCRNKRNNVFVIYKGVRKTLSAWSEDLGIPYYVIKRRYGDGQPPKDILSESKEYNVPIVINGEALSLSEWAIKTGLPYDCLLQRYNAGDRGKTLIRPKYTGSRSVWVKYNGEIKTLAQWARASGIKYVTLKARYRAGKRGHELLRPT